MNNKKIFDDILKSLEPNEWIESDDVEFKAGQGRNNEGELPKDFWFSYSAMANTGGGIIVLGVKELPDNSFEVLGIKNSTKIIKDFHNTANNKEKVSANLLSSEDIEEFSLEEKRIVAFHIPRAPRHLRPIFIGQNPITGSYRRQHDGDFRCSPEQVKQMFADQGTTSLDNRVCYGFDMDDIDRQSLAGYRQLFSLRNVGHPFNELEDLAFLQAIGGYRKDRGSGTLGLTLAGLLMFGKLRSILDELPNYIVDYRKTDNNPEENRWVDRLTTDFTWSGNLYSFCQLVLRKLRLSIPIPWH